MVPVVNENDTVATEEIRFGDNDRLAARVAQAAGAGGVILLSDVDGLYTANPQRDPDASLIEEVPVLDAAVMAMADAGSASGMGSGGMVAKLAGRRDRACRRARTSPSSAGGATTRCRPSPPMGAARSSRATGGSGARKAWLAGRLTAHGRILIDAGAATALAGGASLLPAGATAHRRAISRAAT